MSLIQQLPAGAVDIIGDIHGEIEALEKLLVHLGYDIEGRHPDGRRLVFVGDFCDRGPNSPAVLGRVEQLVKSGNAHAVLGNHEINLLRNDAKDGSGWYFDERVDKDQRKYAPFERASSAQKNQIVEFLSTLPLALERDDLRIIHAAWIADCIEPMRSIQRSDLLSCFDSWDKAADRYAKGLLSKLAEEQRQWPHNLEDPLLHPPFLHARAEYDSVSQMINPIKILTSGVERKAAAPFYVSGKWRFMDRVKWWDNYSDSVPVVIGHYWRRFHAGPDSQTRGESSLFEELSSYAWHGQRGNVFCVDYSVGGRWSARRPEGGSGANFKLGALRWPERSLLFDDGFAVQTIAFGVPKS